MRYRYRQVLGVFLAAVLESLPELESRLPQFVPHINFTVTKSAVFDPEAIADMASNLIGLEHTLCKVARHA